jgi:FAD synthase
VGAAFRFGRDRAGDLGLLQRLGAARGIEVHGVPEVQAGGEVV